MGNTDSRAWNALESWSSTAFLIAGGLLLLFVVLSGLGAFTNVLGEGAVVGAAVVGSGLFGLILAVVGLLGLYPRLSESAPRLSRGGLGALAVALTGILVVIGTLAIVGPPEAPGDVPSFVPPIFISSGILIMLGYALFAVASIRTNTPSRRIGLLLAVPGIVLLWHYIALAAFGSQHVFEIIDYTVISTAFLTIGFLLRTESVSVTSTEPTPDSTP
jgi:hypothetical protein